jgi:hypothetical protein
LVCFSWFYGCFGYYQAIHRLTNVEIEKGKKNLKKM